MAKKTTSKYFKFENASNSFKEPVGKRGSRFFAEKPKTNACVASTRAFDWNSALCPLAEAKMRRCARYAQIQSPRHLCQDMCYYRAYEASRAWHELWCLVLAKGGCPEDVLQDWSVTMHAPKEQWTEEEEDAAVVTSVLPVEERGKPTESKHISGKVDSIGLHQNQESLQSHQQKHAASSNTTVDHRKCQADNSESPSLSKQSLKNAEPGKPDDVLLAETTKSPSSERNPSSSKASEQDWVLIYHSPIRHDYFSSVNDVLWYLGLNVGLDSKGAGGTLHSSTTKKRRVGLHRSLRSGLWDSAAKFKETSPTKRPLRKRPRQPLCRCMDKISPLLPYQTTVPPPPVFHIQEPFQPPISPFGLLEELCWEDPWKLLLSCMMLNQTTRKQLDKAFDVLLSTYPRAEKAAEADREEMEQIIAPCGLMKKRSAMIIRFSGEYLKSTLERPSNLHGIGKYAEDAYDTFVKGKWKEVCPNDHALNWYVDWIRGEDLISQV